MPTIATMPIKEIPLQNTFILGLEASAADALQAMLELKFNHVAVCAGTRLAGFVGIADIMKFLIPASILDPDNTMDVKFAGDSRRLLADHLKKLQNISVRQVLQQAEPLDENCPLLEAGLLLLKNASPLPVVDGDGNFKGMLSRRLFVEYLHSQEKS